MSSELDGEWSEGLDYGWPQAMTFVIDVKLRDEAALDVARNQFGTTARVLAMMDGVQVSDMGIGLAIREDRDRLLAVFDQPASTVSTSSDVPEKMDVPGKMSTSSDAPENLSEPSAEASGSTDFADRLETPRYEFVEKRTPGRHER